MADDLTFDVIPVTQIPRDEFAGWGGKPVVLVVDDETVIADTLSIILSSSGYSVLTAYNGERALELARVTPPNLLLSDVVMPGMTGIDLAVAVKACAPNCKVLLFSGQAATVDLLAVARDAGHSFNVLSKPIHPSDLLRSIAATIDSEPVLAPS